MKNACSNRTLLELKFVGFGIESCPEECSNRTLLELKFIDSMFGLAQTAVPIVPYWN